jgi:GH3 auxin-responsive promoter
MYFSFNLEFQSTVDRGRQNDITDRAEANHKNLWTNWHYRKIEKKAFAATCAEIVKLPGHCDICPMGIKSALLRPIARVVTKRLDNDLCSAELRQEQIFKNLIRNGRKTKFGCDHGFDSITNYNDFYKQVPVRDYESLRPYIELIKQGDRDILWPGRPRYFAKTSGTTSGVKYIPITTDSIPNHIGSARNALFNYFTQTGNGKFFDGKMIFLSGSPTLDDTGGIPTGRLSGIVNHLVPGWIRKNQMPSYHVNCIGDWEEKVRGIVKETIGADMRLISGIPPWVQMYYEMLIDASGKSAISELFPAFSLFVHGGVNYAPYAAKLEALVGKNIDTLETYPASEGFIAYQDRWPFEGLRLNVNSGIFFEFIPLNQMVSENPDRLTLADVEIDKDYAVVINNNAGLWGYNIGDTIRFVSVDPPRIVVSGRVKHFISAFGEHVIAKETDQAMTRACARTNATVVEFTVAPQIDPSDGQAPYHEWFVEFAKYPTDIQNFADEIERSMLEQNTYYKDLIDGKILRPVHITEVKEGGFRSYMHSQGKLGGQNKVARLMNNRSIADLLKPFSV